jgi:hypothetical protein
MMSIYYTMKKPNHLIVLILIFSILSLACAEEAVEDYNEIIEPIAPCMPGDVDGDMEITPDDYNALEAYIDGGSSLPEWGCPDVNVDGMVTAEDLECLNSYLEGRIKEWAACTSGERIESDELTLSPAKVEERDDGFVTTFNGYYGTTCGVDMNWCMENNPFAQGDGMFLFDWGDGMFSCSGFPARHLYREEGVYLLEVIARSSCGAESYQTARVRLSAEAGI